MFKLVHKANICDPPPRRMPAEGPAGRRKAQFRPGAGAASRGRALGR